MFKKKENLNNKNISVQDNDRDYENCVICWKKTNILKKTHIENRQFYITSVGQLCEQCYVEIYHPAKEIEIIESEDYLFIKEK